MFRDALGYKDACSKFTFRKRRDKEGLRMQEKYIWRQDRLVIICVYFNILLSHSPTVNVNVSMYATDYSVIETPVKKLYDSVLQLSGPHNRRSKTGRGFIDKMSLMPLHESKRINKHTH